MDTSKTPTGRPRLRAHPNYNYQDHQALRAKGYTTAQIAKLWQRATRPQPTTTTN